MPKLIISIAFVLGLIGGSFFLFFGFQHNPQGEFFEPMTGKIDFGYSFLIFISWFLIIAASSLTLFFVILRSIKFFKPV